MQKKLQKMKLIFIIIVYLFSLLSNTGVVLATKTDLEENKDTGQTTQQDTESVPITPEVEQFLELRAVNVEEIEGQDKQVTMELWSNKVEFERI